MEAVSSSYFTYNKAKVIQALRYHFISRKEIKVLMILVNVFAVVSAGMYFYHKISPLAFLLSSTLWFILMFVFWYLLPLTIYKRAATFRDKFRANFNSYGFGIENERGSRSWEWKEFTDWMETPNFFHLYFNSRSFFIVPKDAFAEDDVHIARTWMKEKIRKVS